MNINIKKFLSDSGMEEPVYPGKKTVRKCPQPGEFKGHSVAFDWRNPAFLKVEVEAGLSGRKLPPELLHKYPVSFQTPTFVKIDTANDSSPEVIEEEDEGEGKASSGKGGGGKAMKKKKGKILDAFSRVVEGSIPETGKVTEMVVMGMQISERAFDRAIDVLTSQISRGKIAATDILAEAGKFITRYTPPSFLAPKGNEDAVYKYDREKTDPMFGPSMAK